MAHSGQWQVVQSRSVVEELRGLDVDAMTPEDALDELKKKVGDGGVGVVSISSASLVVSQ